MDQFENTLCNTSGKKNKKRSIILKRDFFVFPLYKEKYMSHLYGTGEITIAWQFAYCLVGNLFLEATTRSIEIIDGDDFLLEHHCLTNKQFVLANLYSFSLVLKGL